MKPLPLVAIALATVLASSQAQERKPTWCVFLVRGDHPPQASKEEIARYQTAHINNFKRLFEEGKLVSAGPLQDKTQSKRGIVVFCVKTREEVIRSFDPDPYVQKGFMRVEALPLSPEFGRLNTTGIDPDGIVENRIAVLELVSTGSPPATSTVHLDYLRKEGSKAELAFYGALGDSTTLRGIALFRGKEEPAITQWLDNEPLVKAGILKYTLMPQWLSRGVL